MGPKCLICGWPMAEHSQSQIRTCQHRHEELKKKRLEETRRRAAKR